MAMYKYTMKKYLYSWSTWIIIAITFVLVFVLGGWVPFLFFDPKTADASSVYMAVSIGLITGMTAFIAVFTCIFAGFKSAQMFKDEVEDGTFLLLLSKPIPRGKIIFQKWLALQTIMAIYTLITALTMALGMVVFDEGSTVYQLSTYGISTLRSKAWTIAMIVWAILIIFGLIFSSIALLLSTKLSTGTTIGISIAIGVVIPMTSLISMFAKKPEVVSIKNPQFESFRAEMEALNSQFHSDEVSSRINEIYEEKIEPKFSGLPIDIPTGMFDNFINSFREFYDYSNTNQGLANIGYLSGKTDGYRTAWVADLNFHVQQIASMAADVAIPPKNLSIYEETLDGTFFTSTRKVPAGEVKDLFVDNDASEFDNYLDQMIRDTMVALEEFSTATHNLFYSTFSVLFDNMQKDNKNALLNDFKFTMNTFTFEEINKAVFENPDFANISNIPNVPPIPNTPWSAMSHYNPNKDTIKLTFEDVMQLINRMTVVEALYETLTDTTYGELSNNMYDNYNSFNGSSKPTQKLSYIIPEVGRLISVDFRNTFVEFYVSNISRDDVYAETLLHTMYYAYVTSDPLSRLFFSNLDIFNSVSLANAAIKIRPGYDIRNQDPESDYDYMFNELNLYGQDLNVYNTLHTIDENGSLVKFVNKPYINKYGLLGFYLGLAFILVPVSYLIIRKQDYR